MGWVIIKKYKKSEITAEVKILCLGEKGVIRSSEDRESVGSLKKCKKKKR